MTLNVTKDTPVKESPYDWFLDCHEFDTFVNERYNVKYNSLTALANADVLQGNDSALFIQVPDMEYENNEWYGMSFDEWFESERDEKDMPIPERVLNHLYEQGIIPGGQYVFKAWW
jgi:hypothetical protein